MIEENKQDKNNSITGILGFIVIIPLVLVIIIIASPFILYFLVIQSPIQSARKRKFMKANKGKVLLCVTTSIKYDLFKKNFSNDLKLMGIHDVVVFNGETPNNKYDDFDWDHLILRKNGFPLLLKISEKEISQLALKADFQAFFKKEIDSIQLMSTIKRKMLDF